MNLARIRAAGFDFKILPAGKLGVTGPRPTAEQIRFFAANKADIIAGLRAEAVQASPLVKSALDLWPGAEIVAIRDLPPDVAGRFEERAGIVAEGCNVSRPVAEALADHDLANDPATPRAWH